MLMSCVFRFRLTMVLNSAAVLPSTAKLAHQKKRQSIDNSMIRFPKLDECAHFHYEFAELVSWMLDALVCVNTVLTIRLISGCHWSTTERTAPPNSSTWPVWAMCAISTCLCESTPHIEAGQCGEICRIFAFSTFNFTNAFWIVLVRISNHSISPISLHSIQWFVL